MQSLGVIGAALGRQQHDRATTGRSTPSNTASDWYFENVRMSNAATLPADSPPTVSSPRIAQQGVATVLTVPLIGYVAKDAPRDLRIQHRQVRRADRKRLAVAPQLRQRRQDQAAAWSPATTRRTPASRSAPAFVAGLGRRTGQPLRRGGQRRRALLQSGQRAGHLVGAPTATWHPLGLKYDQLRDRTYQYAAAIKAADPAAQTLGPVVMGWTYYWHSPYDGQRQDWANPDDRNAHGGTPLVPWYLQQMQAYEQAHGMRILDFLDLHYYPPAAGVALAAAGNAATQALRLRSTRSLWDPTYVDESWIAAAGPEGGIVKLIPRMREWVDANYPGTKLAITEYNWGALEHINGALAQADVLGIFGREGLDLATLWSPPAVHPAGRLRLPYYRNYNGSGGRFGETSVEAVSSAQDRLAIYAAEEAATGALTLVVINKTAGSLSAPLTLNHFTPTGTSCRAGATAPPS